MGNKLKKTRITEIAELAEFINFDHSEEGFVNPEAIAKANNISFSYGFYEDHFDGLIECIDGRFHIYINLSKSKQPNSPRSRFTFAHELGHFFLDEHRIPLLEGEAPSHKSNCDFVSSQLVEREADLFATNLLMPSQFYVEHVNNLSSQGFDLIKKLSNYFKSSITSTLIRYVKLNLLPCCIFKIQRNEILWAWPSDKLRAKGLYIPLKNYSKIPRDSSTALINSQHYTAGEVVRRGTTASAWFTNVPVSSSQNILMFEESISLGDFGVLTMLYPDNVSI